MTMSNTQIVSEYISNTTFEDLSTEIIHQAKLCILDSIGCAIGGSATEFGRLDVELMKELSPGGDTTILGDGTHMSAPMAAFLNASLANIMDYDDTSTQPPGHPGSPIIQSALAIAEATSASGKCLLTAIVLGYEIALRIGKAIEPSPMRRKEGPIGGWKTFGSVVAAAKTLDLSEEQTRAALGLVGSSLEGSAKASGAQHGVRWISDKRPGLYKIGIGLKALWGVLSALRAQKGYPAPLETLDGIFWTALGTDQCDYEKIIEELGKEFQIMGMAFKPYPCCRYLHAPLDGVAELLNTWNIDVDEINRIMIRGYQPLQVLMTIKEPKDMWEAQFSLPYTVSLVVKGEKPGLGWFNQNLFTDLTIREIAEKVEFELDTHANQLWFEERILSSTIEITTKNGTCKSIFLDCARGHPENPMTKSEIEEKFMRLVSGIIGNEKGRLLCNAIANLEDVIDISSLKKYYTP